MNQEAVIKKTRVRRSSKEPHEDQEKQTIKSFRSLSF